MTLGMRMSVTALVWKMLAGGGFLQQVRCLQFAETIWTGATLPARPYVLGPSEEDLEGQWPFLRNQAGCC